MWDELLVSGQSTQHLFSPKLFSPQAHPPQMSSPSIHIPFQSSKLAGSPKSEASEIMLRTSETILALVRSD